MLRSDKVGFGKKMLQRALPPGLSGALRILSKEPESNKAKPPLHDLGTASNVKVIQ